jgi:hypothetical protein
MRQLAVVAFVLGILLGLSAPQQSLAQVNVSLSAPIRPDPYSIAVRSGGNVPVADLDLDDDECDYGYLDPAGVLQLEYKAGDLEELYIYAESSRDIMLIVEDPLGIIWCDDDSHTDMNPILSMPITFDGTYTIIVGTYSSSSVENATLYLSHTDPSGGTASSSSSGSELDIFGEPTYGRISLGAGFTPDPHTVSIAAGGSVDVDVPGCTYGYVARNPDLNIDYSGTGDLNFYVRADIDTVLLINSASMAWLCDDDSLGDGDPLITIPNATPGIYNVWVGTYSDLDDLPSVTLNISAKGTK